MQIVELAPRETALEAGGHVKGVAVALVCQNKDDEGLGRVRVSYPWHSQPSESYWARIATPMAGKDRGAWFLPEINDEVLVAFDRGDMRFPYVIGALWNGKDKPPAGNSDGKNDQRMIKTRKGHTLSFDDGSRGAVQLALNDGKKLVIDDDGIKLEDKSGNSLVIDSKGSALTIKAATSLTLKAPRIVVDASVSLDLKSGAAMSLRGTVINLN